MLILKQTKVFTDWLRTLRDKRARERIESRLDRLKDGNFGTARSVGGTVTELKVDYGPGYRVYLTRRGEQIVILLCGGDKSSQAKDIQRAKMMADHLTENDNGT